MFPIKQTSNSTNNKEHDILNRSFESGHRSNQSHKISDSHSFQQVAGQIPPLESSSRQLFHRVQRAPQHFIESNQFLNPPASKSAIRVGQGLIPKLGPFSNLPQNRQNQQFRAQSLSSVSRDERLKVPIYAKQFIVDKEKEKACGTGILGKIGKHFSSLISSFISSDQKSNKELQSQVVVNDFTKDEDALMNEQARKFDEQLESIPEISGFESMQQSAQSGRSNFKRSAVMRDEDQESQLYKRFKVSNEQATIQIQKVEEQLESQQKLITSFKQDLDRKLDQKLAELKKIELNIQTNIQNTMRDNFKEYADTFFRQQNKVSGGRSECSDMISPGVRSRAQSQEKFPLQRISQPMPLQIPSFTRDQEDVQKAQLVSAPQSKEKTEAQSSDISTAGTSKLKLDSFIKPPTQSIFSKNSTLNMEAENTNKVEEKSLFGQVNKPVEQSQQNEATQKPEQVTQVHTSLFGAKPAEQSKATLFGSSGGDSVKPSLFGDSKQTTSSGSLFAPASKDQTLSLFGSKTGATDSTQENQKSSLFGAEAPKSLFQPQASIGETQSEKIDAPAVAEATKETLVAAQPSLASNPFLKSQDNKTNPFLNPSSQKTPNSPFVTTQLEKNTVPSTLQISAKQSEQLPNSIFAQANGVPQTQVSFALSAQKQPEQNPVFSQQATQGGNQTLFGTQPNGFQEMKMNPVSFAAAAPTSFGNQSQQSLFSAPAQQPAALTNSLFGNQLNQASLFVAPPQQAPTQSSSLFGIPSQQQQQPSLFNPQPSQQSLLGGASLFQTQQPSQFASFSSFIPNAHQAIQPKQDLFGTPDRNKSGQNVQDSLFNMGSADRKKKK